MMKNRTYLAEKGKHNIGIHLLMLLVSFLLCSGVYADDNEKQPNGRMISVSGYITCKGERISEVLVDAVSTNEETISDREGKFFINVFRGGVVIFQKEGYKTFEYLADEPQDNLIVCLLPVDDVVDYNEEEVKEKQEEKEAVIIIQTKKESKQDQTN